MVVRKGRFPGGTSLVPALVVFIAFYAVCAVVTGAVYVRGRATRFAGTSI